MLDYVWDFVIGIAFTIFFSLLAFILVFYSRSFYYHEIDLLEIESKVGMDKNVIKDRFDDLMDYYSPTSDNDLDIKDFAFSERGHDYFKEYKDSIKAAHIAACIFGIIFFVIITYKAHIKDFQYLLVSSSTTMVISLILFLCTTFDFKKTLDNFFKNIIGNDYKPLEAYQDPIVNLFPEQFFFHCALVIIFFTFICGLSEFMLHRGKLKEYILAHAKKD